MRYRSSNCCIDSSCSDSTICVLKITCCSWQGEAWHHTNRGRWCPVLPSSCHLPVWHTYGNSCVRWPNDTVSWMGNVQKNKTKLIVWHIGLPTNYMWCGLQLTGAAFKNRELFGAGKTNYNTSPVWFTMRARQISTDLLHLWIFFLHSCGMLVSKWCL